MKLHTVRRHSLGDVYLFHGKHNLPLEAYFSGDYTQAGDALRMERYGAVGKIPREEKSIIKLSMMGGCPYRCHPCDAGLKGFFGYADTDDIVEQFAMIIEDQQLSHCQKLKLHLSKLGEPSLHWEASLKALQIIQQSYPHFNMIPVVASLPRNAEQFLSMVTEFFAWDHPLKELKINLGASDEQRRRELYGKVLSLESMIPGFQEALKNVRGIQRITLTLLAMPGENIDTAYFLQAIPEELRSAFTVELYKVNSTQNAQYYELYNHLKNYAAASAFQESMNTLGEHGFFTYFSAPSHGEQVALVATGSSLLGVLADV
jgi:adenine C2-methylase RlmN of 23S rRNA A2503 and tRNA A37